MRTKAGAATLQNYPMVIIGSGPVGVTFARILRSKKLPLLAVTSRNKKKALSIAKKLDLKPSSRYLDVVPDAKLVLIAVSDDAIEEVARTIHESGKLKPGTMLAHTSGALTSEILRGKQRESLAFSLHPLQSFAAGTDRKSLKGVALIYEGDPATAPIARELSDALGGDFMKIKISAKILYHLAASISSNFLVTLTSLAAHLNERAGIPKAKARSILIPLLSGTLENIRTLGVPKALTGPLERGDLLIIQKHLEALRKCYPRIIQLYQTLSLETLKLAKAKGLPAGKAETLERILRKST